jgi:hypothetical protein
MIIKKNRTTELNKKFDAIYSVLPYPKSAIIKSFIVAGIVFLLAYGLTVFRSHKPLYTLLLLLVFSLVAILSLKHTKTLYHAIFAIVSYNNDELWQENDYKKMKLSFSIMEIVTASSLTILFQNIDGTLTTKNVLFYIIAFIILWIVTSKGISDAYRYRYINLAIESLINDK